MKIVLYTHKFPKYSETFIVRQFLYLIKKNVDVHVVSRKSHDLALFPEIQPYVKKRIHYLPETNSKYKLFLMFPIIFIKTFYLTPFATFKYFLKSFKSRGFITTLKKFFSEYPLVYIKPDLVHFEFTAIAREHYHLKYILGFKIITSFRGYGITYLHLEDENYYVNTFNNLDGIHTISRHLINYAHKYRKLPKTIPYKIIPPAIDKKLLTQSRNYNQRDGKSAPVNILTVARFHWKKGYEYVLKAMSILKNKGLRFHYHIVGDGPLKEMLFYLIDLFDLSQEVQVIGKLPFSDTLKEYLWADIFVIGSLSEGFCNAVLEAQALGLPSVVTDTPALLENVEKNVTALVAERRNPEDIAEKLEMLITSPELREKLGMAGRKRVAENYLLDQQAQEFYEFYKYILSKTNSKQ